MVVEAEVVMLPGVLDGRMERCETLDDDFTFDIATTGATGDLDEKLESAFAGAEVRQVERHVGIDNSDERDVWEV